MQIIRRALVSAAIAVSLSGAAIAQNAPAKQAPFPRLVFSVTSTAWVDGAEIPMRHAARGENKSPAFEFHWNLGTNGAAAPDTLKSYAVIFHDVENSSNKTTADTLHWSAFNIPGTASGIAEGLGAGDLSDGTRNGPGLSTRGGNPPPTSDLERDPARSTTRSLSFMPWTSSWSYRPTPLARTCSKPWMVTS
jgi:phosphatidylethanolamine-binding protein (PEBP) family uncharacterized protein